jgi:cell division septal protein FtsQ
MATKAGHGHGHPQEHDHAAPARVTSPLARGLAFRLAWAGGVSALLWLGVVWALQ